MSGIEMDYDIDCDLSQNCELESDIDFDNLEQVDDKELEDIESLIDSADRVDELGEIPEDSMIGLESGIQIEDFSEIETEFEIDENFNDVDSPKVLTREITAEILESRERDTNEILDNYRDNLREYGVAEEKIEEYVNQEREKINAEYESLEHGDTTSNIYHQPENWEEVALSLINSNFDSGYREREWENVGNIEEVEVEHLESEIQEQNIDYSEIYEEIEQESLEEGFKDIQIDAESERFQNALKNFDESTWETFDLEEQKDTIANLADYVVDIIGFENPPQIEYYNNAREGDFGGYDASTNTLHINEYMLYNSNEAADTIAHELWHAHQHECAMNPQNSRDYQYQYNFENYIPPTLGQEAYESQLVEAEARAFAAQFKDRLENIKGRIG